MEDRRRRLAWRGRPGLTLPELLVAIALLGTLGALLLPGLSQDRHSPGGYIGIGAAIEGYSTSYGYVRVHRPLPGTPAEEAGLQPGDLILAVDGISTQGESVGTVVSMIRSDQAGTPVRLTIQHTDAGEPLEMTLIREHIVVASRCGACAP